MSNGPKFIRKRGYTPPTSDFKLLTAEQFIKEPNLDLQSMVWMLDGAVVGFASSDAKYYYTPEPLDITELREAATEMLNCEGHLTSKRASVRLGKALEPFEGIVNI